MKRSPLAVAAAVIAVGMTVSLAACEGQLPTVSAPTESASANPDLTEDQEKEMRAALLKTIEMTVSLAACEGQLPTVSAPTESASANPDLTEDQEKEMRAALLKTIEDCNEQKNPANLGQAMSGPELEIRTSELQVAQKTGKLDPKTTIPTDITQTVIPTDNGWPRSVFSITTTTEDQQTAGGAENRQARPQDHDPHRHHADRDPHRQRLAAQRVLDHHDHRRPAVQAPARLHAGRRARKLQTVGRGPPVPRRGDAQVHRAEHRLAPRRGDAQVHRAEHRLADGAPHRRASSTPRPRSPPTSRRP